MLFSKGSCRPMSMIFVSQVEDEVQEDEEGDEEEDDAEESEGEVEDDEDEDGEVDENGKQTNMAERLLCRCRAGG